MKSSFPIAALALLITAFACLFVCADIERWHEQYAWLSLDWPWRLVGLFGGAAVFGGLVGVAYMFVSTASWRVRLLSPLAGALAGEVGALILVAPGPPWRTIFAITVLIGTAVLFRLGAE